MDDASGDVIRDEVAINELQTGFGIEQEQARAIWDQCKTAVACIQDCILEVLLGDIKTAGSLADLLGSPERIVGFSGSADKALAGILEITHYYR